MKIKSVIITFFSCFLLAMPLAAQAPQEVTLTVSSDGSTKEEATKNALRSAIEQAYGVFVSANTTILNDELVKDEIVTVSNGSIKDYKEILPLRSQTAIISYHFLPPSVSLISSHTQRITVANVSLPAIRLPLMKGFVICNIVMLRKY